MAMLPDMSSGNVTVIGDVMLDRFWSGGSRRISPEAPVPVVNVMSQEDRAGGAGNQRAASAKVRRQHGLGRRQHGLGLAAGWQ